MDLIEQKQGIPPQELRRQRLAAGAQLAEMTDRFIMSGLRLSRFQELGGPSVLMKNVERMFQEAGRMVDYLSTISGKQKPEAIIKARGQGLLHQMDQGYYGTKRGQLNREDRARLEHMLAAIDRGELQIERFGEKEKSSFEEHIHSLDRIVDSSNKFYVNGDESDLGTWIGVEPIGYSALSVALKPGRTITIEVSDWDEPIFPRHQDQELYYTETYPAENSMFYYSTDQRDNKRRIVRCLGEFEDLVKRVGKYGENIDLLKYQEGVRIENRISSEMREKLLTILAQDVGIDLKTLGDVNIGRLLYRVMKFVVEEGSAEEVDLEGAMDIDWLVKQYENERSFPGDCKSAATIMAGFCDALGLPVRVVDGSVVYLEDGSGGGHTWPEVYLPKLKQWIPVDAAIGTFLTYPLDGLTYFMLGKITPEEGKQLKVKVDYYDNT